MSAAGEKQRHTWLLSIDEGLPYTWQPYIEAYYCSFSIDSFRI